MRSTNNLVKENAMRNMFQAVLCILIIALFFLFTGCSLNDTSQNNSGKKTPITILANGCVNVSLPVCGVDGNTYMNKCVADRNNVSITKPVACDAQINATANVTVASTTLCESQPAVVVCAYNPKLAKNVTYKNACYARLGGATDVKVGSCAVPVISAAQSEFCAKQPIKTVCGEDGRDYQNSCYANAARINVTKPVACSVEYKPNASI